MYSDVGKIIESQAECERPRYDPKKLKKAEDEQRMFQTVKEASEFWKLLWEQEGIADPSAPWLGEVREAIKEKVHEPREDGFTLESTSARNVITKKKNWSAPGSDEIAVFGRNRNKLQDIPWWFTGGKKSLIPKPGQFSSENQGPITYLNTSCLLKPMNHHLEKYRLMERKRNAVELLTTSSLIEWCVKTVRGGSRISVWPRSMLERPLTRSITEG